MASVVIPTYQNGGALKRVLAAYIKQMLQIYVIISDEFGVILEVFMIIESIKLYSAKIPRKYPFRTSRTVQKSVDDVFVEITDSNLIGTGEAAPRPHINDETLESAFSDLKSIAQTIVGFTPEQAIELVYSTELGPSAKLGMEMALLDVICQEKQIPICDYVGNSNQEQISYCGLLSSNEAGEKMIKKAASLQNRGYSIVRVKIGELPFEEDFERIKSLRELWGSSVGIWLDVNQAWKLDEATVYLGQLEPFNIMMIEQPLDAGDYKGHSTLRKNTKIPIMLDESVQTAEDLERAIAINCLDAVNLKFLKLGSFRETKRMVERAQEIGLAAYCGGTAVTDVFAQYARHLEFALPGLQYFSGGLPRSNSFIKNPTTPLLAFAPDEPYATKPTANGLGIRLDHNTFNKYVAHQWAITQNGYSR